MNNEQYERATELFNQLCQLPRAEREQWLDGQAEDAVVIELVRTLEAKDRALGGSLDPLAVQPATDRLKETRSNSAQPTKTTPDTLKDDSATLEASTNIRFFEEDYVDLVEIGRGGVGTIYRAHQKSLNRTVAIKMIGRDTELSTASRLRFQLEAEAAARLNHANIVPIYEVGGAT